MVTAPTLDIGLQNSTDSNTVYAYVTGRSIERGGALFLLRSDGKTPYLPDSPPSTLEPLRADCAIRLGSPGSTVVVTIPRIAGARVWFCVDNQLTFKLNPGPALVEPSVTNPTDPNLNLNWSFAELTYNENELYANISYVDFVSVPVSLTLRSASGGTKHVAGMGPNGLDLVCDRLRAQDNIDGAGWSRLIVQEPRSGRNLRAMSPNTGIVTNNSLFQGYYQPYVDQVWAKYSRETLAINTQAPQWGVISGQVRNGELDLDGQRFGQPSSADIFSCSTGPFEERGSAQRGAMIARLTAAFHRSTLLVNHTLPDSPPPFYQHPITNHYSRIVHETNLDGRGYAFPYDDVTATGASDSSGAVNSGDPTLLTIAVGGNDARAINKDEL